MEIINGKEIAKITREEIKQQVLEIKNKYNKEIGLAVILVGENPASQTYVNNKVKACEEVGIKSYYLKFDENISQNELEKIIIDLSNNQDIHGILVQLPLPKHLDEKFILSLIPDKKDVDGFSESNIGKLFMGTPSTISCTPYGVMKMLEKINYSLEGKNAVVIGRSNIVGKPMAALLLNANATVTICHSKTKNLQFYTKNADLIVVAIGKPKFLKGDMINQGAVVVDVGINRVNGKLVGDVDFEDVKDKCSYITPVPGGVGPMTITMLLYNTLNLFKNERNN